MSDRADRLEDHFSPDYATARERFRAAARRVDAALYTLPLSERGPRSEPLTIDIARLGPAGATRVLLHTSGLHGVEAYAGSAIQLALLGAPPPLPADTAAVFVHVLNPFGMAWLRRANEHNVDLNRNFTDRHEDDADTTVYARLDPLLNPRSPPRRDAFLLRAGLQVLRRGRKAVQQAIARGQYRFAHGLFYGGTTLEPGPRLFLGWLAEHLAAARTVTAVDVHTGLGPRGIDTLLVDAAESAPSGLAAALGKPFTDAAGDDPSAYVVRGSLAAGLRRALPRATLHAITQEFGTEPLLRVIAALRDENRWHLHGDGRIDHWSKRRLRETLCPADIAWRRAVVQRGVAAATGALAWSGTPASSEETP